MTTLAEALAPRSDQLNADDLIPGPRVLKITSARISKDGREIKVVLNFEGDNGKPWKPCKTMGRAMVMAWSITEPEQFVGKSVRVYRDPEVKFGDQGAVGGIRISHMSHIDKPVNVKLTVSQGKKGMFTFHPLVSEVQQQRQSPEQWLDGYLAEVARVPTLDALASCQLRAKAALAKLETAHPELHARATAAVAERVEQINPTAGRADTDHGDQFPTDDFATDATS